MIGRDAIRLGSRTGAAAMRLITGAGLAILFIVLVWIEPLHPLFVLVVALMAAVGAAEFYGMARARGLHVEKAAGVVLTAAVVVLGAPLIYLPALGLLPLLVLAILILACLHLFRGGHSLAGFAASFLGVFYVGLFAAYVARLHSLPETGPGMVTLLLLAVALSDTGAYTVGSQIGRHKMAPRVSPNKSWEGAAGGVVFAMIGLALVYWIKTWWTLGSFPAWPLWQYIATGAMLAIAGQIGDLLESMLKRDAGVKDSGRLIPGHGGVLDRCDGFLFAAPVLYHLIVGYAAT